MCSLFSSIMSGQTVGQVVYPASIQYRLEHVFCVSRFLTLSFLSLLGEKNMRAGCCLILRFCFNGLVQVPRPPGENPRFMFASLLRPSNQHFFLFVSNHTIM